jgi:hypothetical protein
MAIDRLKKYVPSGSLVIGIAANKDFPSRFTELAPWWACRAPTIRAFSDLVTGPPRDRRVRPESLRRPSGAKSERKALRREASRRRLFGAGAPFGAGIPGQVATFWSLADVPPVDFFNGRKQLLKRTGIALRSEHY